MNILFHKNYTLLLKTTIFGILISKVICTDCDILFSALNYFGVLYGIADLTNCCSMEGITCDAQNNVIEIKLKNLTPDTSKSEPQSSKAYEELANLKHLTTLELISSNIEANKGIPSSIGNLTNLNTLILSHNYYSFTDTSIPESIGNLVNLVKLDLSHNYLKGQLPSSICNLTKLKYLDLSGNDINGSFPKNCEKLVNLEYLNLKENDITGTVPNYPKLKECYYGSACPVKEAICQSNYLYGNCKNQVSGENYSSKSFNIKDFNESFSKLFIFIIIVITFIGIISLYFIIKKSKGSKDNSLQNTITEDNNSNSNNNNNNKKRGT